MVYLLGVVVVAIVWGFRLAAATCLVSVLAFDFFHIPPLFSLSPTASGDWVAVTVYLIVALAASTLSELARLRAAEADQRRWEAEASRDELRMLADQQAALRRIATLVARAVAPSELFSAVAEELARCLGVTQANLVRYEADGGSILLASHDDHGSTKEVPVGRRFAYEGENVASMVLRAGRRPPKVLPGAIRISRRTRSVSTTMKDAATTAPSHSGGVVGRTNSDIKRARMGRTSVVASESAPSDVASGLDDHQPGIAHRLWVTEGTVEKHVRSILTKLNLPETGDDHRRVLAVITFLEAR